jgi:hypothetical protein
MKDLQLKNLDLLIRSVKIENKNQIKKWGIQDQAELLKKVYHKFNKNLRKLNKLIN